MKLSALRTSNGYSQKVLLHNISLMSTMEIRYVAHKYEIRGWSMKLRSDLIKLITEKELATKETK